MIGRYSSSRWLIMVIGTGIPISITKQCDNKVQCHMIVLFMTPTLSIVVVKQDCRSLNKSQVAYR